MEAYLAMVMSHLFVGSYIWRDSDAAFLKMIDETLYNIVFDSAGVRQLNLNMNELPPLSQRKTFGQFWLTDTEHRWRRLILFRDLFPRSNAHLGAPPPHASLLQVFAKYLARIYLAYLHNKVTKYLQTTGHSHSNGNEQWLLEAHVGLSAIYLRFADNELHLFYNPVIVDHDVAPESVHHALLSPVIRTKLADVFRRMLPEGSTERGSEPSGILFLRDERDCRAMRWKELQPNAVVRTLGSASYSWIDAFSGKQSETLWRAYPAGFYAHYDYFALAWSPNSSSLCHACVNASYCALLTSYIPAINDGSDNDIDGSIVICTWAEEKMR